MKKYFAQGCILLALSIGCAIMEEEPNGTLILLNHTSDRCLRFDEPVPPGQSDEMRVRAGLFELPIDVGDMVDGACDFVGRERWICTFAIEAEGAGELLVTDDIDMPTSCRPCPQGLCSNPHE